VVSAYPSASPARAELVTGLAGTVQTWGPAARAPLVCRRGSVRYVRGIAETCSACFGGQEIRAKHSPGVCAGPARPLHDPYGLGKSRCRRDPMLMPDVRVELSSRCPSGEAHDLERYGPAWATITCRRGSVGALCSASTGLSCRPTRRDPGEAGSRRRLKISGRCTDVQNVPHFVAWVGGTPDHLMRSSCRPPPTVIWNRDR
jgi:hypothetical protein